MINIILGIIVLISFIGLVVYCIKGYNMMIGLGIMAALWLAIALIGNAITPNSALEGYTVVSAINEIFHKAPASYAQNTLVAVIFGAFFGRVLMESGITSSMIKKTVELGGDHPAVTMTLLIIVVGLIFTSAGGMGLVMAIAMLVLPILFSMGIPPVIALFAYMAPIMAGSFVSAGLYSQYTGIVGAFDERFLNEYTFNDYFKFGIVGMIICLVLIIAVCLFLLNRSKKAHAWATPAGSAETRSAPWYSWIGTILPIVFIIVLHLSVIPAFLLSVLYVLLTCGMLKGSFKDVCSRIVRLFSDGITDIAPVIAFLLVLSMFNGVAKFVASYFEAIFGGIIPTTPLAITIVFAVCIPLGFFRGPTNLAGCGAAVMAVVLSVTQWPIELLFPLIFTASCLPQSIDITQSWVAWGIGYTKVDSRDYLKIIIPYGWVTGAILCLLAYFMYLA